MLAFKLERTRREFQARQQILAPEVGKFRQHVLKRITRREVFQHRLHRITQAANDRLAVAEVRLGGDALQSRLHGCTVPGTKAPGEVFSRKRKLKFREDGKKFADYFRSFQNKNADKAAAAAVHGNA